MSNLNTLSKAQLIAKLQHHGITTIEALEWNVYIPWSVDDVKSVRPHLSDDQSMEILLIAKDKHDANEGINWSMLKFWADELYPKE